MHAERRQPSAAKHRFRGGYHGASLTVDLATTAVLGLSGDAAIAALMRRLRAYGAEHPARYLAVPPDPMHDPALAQPAAAL